MIISSRRLRPLWLAFACWLLVLVVPTTRNQLVAALNSRFEAVPEDEIFNAETVRNTNPLPEPLLKRFPGNKEVELYAAQENNNAAKWLKNDPQNVLLLTLAMQQQLNSFDNDRKEGPLTNPDYPKPYVAPTPMPVPAGAATPNVEMPVLKVPTPAQWQEFIALARRAQKLEPNNAYFDFILLYGLYATRQDVAARAVLSSAARKTVYTDHTRDLILNRIHVFHLASGKPISPRDQNSVWVSSEFGVFSKFRQTSRWIMEGVIADRLRGNHNQALNAAFDLVHLSRLMRRESHTLIGSLVGTACEAIAMGNTTMPPAKPAITRKPRPGDPLTSFQSDPRMLYFYANSQKRSDITSYLNKEWIDMGNWKKLSSVIMDQDWTGNPKSYSRAIVASERFASMALKAAPSIVVLAFLYLFLSRRFQDTTAASGGFSRGVWFGLALWVFAFVCDVLCALSAEDNASVYGMDNKYMFGGGILSVAPAWIPFGLAAAVVCFGLNQTVLWQKEQAGKRTKLGKRLRTALDAPEDGLARYDIGWFLGLALHITTWLLLLGSFLLFCCKFEEIKRALEDYMDASYFLMSLALLISVLLSIRVWRSLPLRNETFRLSFRMVLGALAGFFVATSVLYALVAFAMLPVSQSYERTFESAMGRGEVAIARAKLGL